MGVKRFRESIYVYRFIFWFGICLALVLVLACYGYQWLRIFLYGFQSNPRVPLPMRPPTEVPLLWPEFPTKEDDRNIKTFICTKY